MCNGRGNGRGQAQNSGCVTAHLHPPWDSAVGGHPPVKPVA
ncbi:hypothetical protein TVNIR_3239 [Thioalkalivibrio nitratireducens DSM 14787]|uniref:Uncharacterized protein n=1 Tax=Thioalkalivibrio nitratireducens (strain DSM 14787 / UNIQEM 213 / ALEN2) TaxID=1255043 RepID=L0E0W9_THIND|nr:hypothetical protein TVNIR_3239 [Thioalkalivibrio nitratireducens DSM 14787]